MKPKLATAALAGCFGCHMSLLDIDERLLQLMDLVELDRSPLDDIKHFAHRVDIGLVEGGCANEENVRVLRDFRRNCNLLVSIGDCATMGGVAAMRNRIPLEECLAEAFREGPSVHDPSGSLPDDPELPRLLRRVVPCHEVVHIDYHLAGCPPSADTLWTALTALIAGRPLALGYELIEYD